MAVVEVAEKVKDAKSVQKNGAPECPASAKKLGRIRAAAEVASVVTGAQRDDYEAFNRLAAGERR
jgi:hypothetical protein